MEKTIVIDGMSCEHCAARVKKALEGIPGVTAQLDLAAKTAKVASAADVPDALLRETVEDAGYDVISIA